MGDVVLPARGPGLFGIGIADSDDMGLVAQGMKGLQMPLAQISGADERDIDLSHALDSNKALVKSQTPC